MSAPDQIPHHLFAEYAQADDEAESVPPVRHPSRVRIAAALAVPVAMALLLGWTITFIWLSGALAGGLLIGQLLNALNKRDVL